MALLRQQRVVIVGSRKAKRGQQLSIADSTRALFTVQPVSVAGYFHAS
jgi:hypothetical protein